MANYRVNKNSFTNPKGDNEVHNEGCVHYSQLTNYEYLGDFVNCIGAVQAAKYKGYKADGCIKCCPLCHKE
jgi:hypothetical protein